MAYLQRNLLSNPPVSPFSRSLKTHLFWFRGLQGLPPGATGIQWRVNIITFNRQSIIQHIQYVIVHIYMYRIAPPILYHLERLVFNRELKSDSTLYSPHSIICCILYLGLIIYHIAPGEISSDLYGLSGCDILNLTFCRLDFHQLLIKIS